MEPKKGSLADLLKKSEGSTPNLQATVSTAADHTSAVGSSKQEKFADEMVKLVTDAQSKKAAGGYGSDEKVQKLPDPPSLKERFAHAANSGKELR